MRLTDIFTEARRNPSRNPRVNAYQRLMIRTEQNPKNTFVSMTTVDKLGINPQSEYYTPLGIYAYPSRFVLDTAKISMRDLPFVGDAPYVNIFNASGNILVLTDITEIDYNSYCEKIRKILVSEYVANNFSETAEESARAANIQMNKIMSDAPYESNVSRLYGGRLWYVTYRVTKEITALRGSKNAPVIWNKIFRSIGIHGCVDYGAGIIHENEPTQAVFFSTEGIRDVERVLNKWDELSQIESIDRRINSTITSSIIAYLSSNPTSITQFIKEYINRFSLNFAKDSIIQKEIIKKIHERISKLNLEWEWSAEHMLVDYYMHQTNEQKIWDIVTRVKSLTNAQKYEAIIEWMMSGVQPKTGYIINQFKSSDFIAYLKNLAEKNPADKKTWYKINKILGSSEPTLQ